MGLKSLLIMNANIDVITMIVVTVFNIASEIKHVSFSLVKLNMTVNMDTKMLELSARDQYG